MMDAFDEVISSRDRLREIMGMPNHRVASKVVDHIDDICRRFIEREEPGALLLPMISTGFCDMHYLRESFGTTAYGFWPVRQMPAAEYLNGMHNRDERIHVDDLLLATSFHIEAARELVG